MLSSQAVSEYSGGDHFGELALLSDEVRKASVRATSAVKCWTLDKATFIMHIPSHLFENEHVISIREGLRTAPGVTGVIDRYWGVFWDTLEDASRPTWSPQRQNNAKILREQYVQLHTRLNKALSQAFAEQAAVLDATKDWAEDISAFSGESKDVIWLQDLKIKLRSAGIVDLASAQARPAPNPRPALWRLPLLTPQVNAGSLYRCSWST